MNELRSIRFVHKIPPYNPGETASFPFGMAERWINQGAAVWNDQIETEDGEIVRVDPSEIVLEPTVDTSDSVRFPRLHGTNDQEYADNNGAPSDPIDPTPTLVSSVDSVAKYDRRIPDADEPHTEDAHVSSTKEARENIEAEVRTRTRNTRDGARVRVSNASDPDESTMIELKTDSVVETETDPPQKAD